MKKMMVLIGLMITLLFGQFAMAGLARFDSSQFNDIIAENQKQEKELRRKLQNEAGIDYKLKKTPLHIDRKDVVGSEAEQVAVSSSKTVSNVREKRIQNYDHADMKRLSQEFDQEGQ